MKKKITISLPVNSDKCRANAMQIAVSSPGVISVTSDADKNQLVVTGDGVDFFLLMKSLKRKFRCASIVSIEEVKPPEKKDDKKDEKKKEECCKICCCPCPCACPPPGYNNPCVQYYPVCQPVYDSNPSCSIQ
ncbi:heavy metal-associated isoprenylated plant protein 16-like [Ipomoea triloba]|uniref:heavy metal-associated isoprenylated plant protein 16-like n=1 Tax=Ipomoea triloba TaxID=35885 RepID=UPI00125D160A|nr:heavy metal-associated isoprenylated plant protein 16-like [Ipomoea triloba]